MDCLADPTKIRVMAEFSRDVREALPFLASLLPRAGYNDAAAILTLVREGQMITVYPKVVTLAKALDGDDARATLEWLRTQINEAWVRRDELSPCFERRRSPRLLDVYQLLPRDNCRRCDEATCIAFAARLIIGDRRSEDCKRLYGKEYARNRVLLAEWLGTDG